MQYVITVKVYVTDKEDTGYEGQVRLTFEPDYAEGRNSEWALYTPGLSLQMFVKAEVADQFSQYQPLTLTFTPEPWGDARDND